MHIKKLSAEIGVEITGIDLRRGVSPEARAQLQALIDQHSLLSFPGQQLSPEEQEDFTALFGPKTDEGGRGTFHGFISNKRVDSGVHADAALMWHSDNAWSPAPTHYIALGGHHVEGDLSPTLFASAARAARELPAELRGQVQSLNVINLADLAPPPEGDLPRSRVPVPEQREMAQALPEDHYFYPRTVYPILWTHPRTGDELVFVNEHMSICIEGMDPAQSEPILASLFEILYDLAYIYDHAWRQGDLVIWDNLALQHGRRAFHGKPGVRTLIRTTINPAQDLYLTHGKRVADFAETLERAAGN